MPSHAFPGFHARISFLFAALSLLIAAGCSDEPTHPATEPSLSLEGGVVPEVVFEGESATIEAWGNARDMSFGRLVADVTSWPTDAIPGRIDIRAEADSRSTGGSTPFEAHVQLPPLLAGEYTVHFAGRGAIQPLTVLSARGWLRYRSFADPVLPDEMLMIHDDGTVVAHREGERGVVRLALERPAIAEIRSWFETAAFFDLDDRYVDDDEAEVGRVEIAYTQNDRAHRVFAEKDQMPDALSTLVDHLNRFTSRVLSTAPDLAPVTGYIEIDPVQADPGTERAMRLVLVNEGSETVTLSFPTQQQYDVVLLRPPFHDPNGPGSPDDGEGHDGMNGPGGGHNGPHHGANGNGPNDPDDVLLWNWAHGRSFDQTASEIVLEPNGVASFGVTWSGRDNAGDIVRPGIYHVRAQVLGEKPIRVRAARLLVTGEVPNRVPLVGTLSVDPATAGAATPREITLSVTNLNDFAVDVTFNSTQQFDLAVVDPHRGGSNGPNDPHQTDHRAIVWLWSDGRGFADVVETVTWAPGEVRSYTATWDGLDREEEPVEPGLYMLHAWTTGTERTAIRSISVVVSE